MLTKASKNAALAHYKMHLCNYTVGNAPTILSKLSDVICHPNKTAKIECDVSLGIPKGEIRW